MKVGEQVRARRNELDLSLREVARSTDLSSGFLSQVENNQVSPSLSSLARIADALHVPVFRLLSLDDRDPVVRSGARPAVDLPHPEMTVDLLTPFLSWQLLPYMRNLEPGEVSKAVRLDKASEEWMFVHSGQAAIELDDAVHVLSPGDTIHFQGYRLVSISAVGDEPLQLICLMTPPLL